MPMPHRTQMQLIKRRLVGKDGSERTRELRAISSVQIKTGDYAFTTTRPVPALTRVGGVLVQLVEIPGLIRGASEGRGGGRALLGVLRGADAMVLCHDASSPLGELKTIRTELAAAGIDHRAIVAVTKLDEAASETVEKVARESGLPAVGVSVLDDESLDRF